MCTPSTSRLRRPGGVHLQALADYALLLPPSERAPYVAAARLVAQQLVDDILPQMRWADVETFYSCSNKPESAYDNFTKQPPRNTLSTGWAIDGLASMFELTREHLRFWEVSMEGMVYQKGCISLFDLVGVRGHQADGERVRPARAERTVSWSPRALLVLAGRW